MGLRRRLTLPLLPLLLMGCAGGEGDAAPASSGETRPAPHILQVPAPRELTTRDGRFQISWAPVGGEVPVNEHFEAEVTVRRAASAGAEGELVEDAVVSMTCFMPDHGHGMLREPRTEPLATGTYRIRGLLLHMGGDWSISISASIDGLASTADDSISL